MGYNIFDDFLLSLDDFPKRIFPWNNVETLNNILQWNNLSFCWNKTFSYHLTWNNPIRRQNNFQESSEFDVFLIYGF